MKVLLLFLGYLALSAADNKNLPKARFDGFMVYRLHMEDELKLKHLLELNNNFPVSI